MNTPGTPRPGDQYFNALTATIFRHNGIAWVDMGDEWTDGYLSRNEGDHDVSTPTEQRHIETITPDAIHFINPARNHLMTWDGQTYRDDGPVDDAILLLLGMIRDLTQRIADLERIMTS